MNFNRLFLPILTIFFLTNCTEKTTDKTSVSKVETLQMAQLEYEIHSLLGEGAFWNYKSQELYWIDIDGKKLHIYDPDTKTNRSFPTPTRIGTVVPQTDTTAVIALEDGIYIINTENGNIVVLSDIEKEMTINRFNDGKCDPNGNLWVGSMHLEQMAPLGSVYKISATGETIKMIDSVTISNGIVWTKDATTMYYIDTPTQNIRAFDFDTDTSTISNERTAVSISEALGFPDGMAIDEEDMLWVGLWNGNAVGRFDPKTGELVSRIEVPAHNITSCAFGGKNLDRLYITTASVDMTEEEKANYPLAGSLFVADPGVKGVRSELFRKNN
jgi:sugar lactone lactonase YvrE